MRFPKAATRRTFLSKGLHSPLTVCCAQRGGLAMEESGTTLYVGTYTGTGSTGIYAFRFHPENTSFDPLGCVAQGSNPSYLCGATRRKTLYAVDETTGPSKTDGTVLAYRVATSPTHTNGADIVIDARGTFLHATIRQTSTHSLLPHQ